MKTIATLFSSLFLFPLLVVQQLVPSVDSSVAFDNRAQCGISDGMELCAIKTFMGPSPGTIVYPNGTNVTKYYGGYAVHFMYVDGVTNGTVVDFSDANYTGLEVTVMRDDDNNCTTMVTVNGTDYECASCTFCDTGDYNYEVDCTDVDLDYFDFMFTRPLTCNDSILPIFFPLDDDYSALCGSPTDSCMNEDNWNQCVAIVQQGCQQLAVMESCPLQFECGDA